jgi:hypothetical protein
MFFLIAKIVYKMEEPTIFNSGVIDDLGFCKYLIIVKITKSYSCWNNFFIHPNNLNFREIRNKFKTSENSGVLK